MVSYILPPKWTSTAIIALPGDEQVQVLDELITNLTVLDIKVDVSANYLLSTFKQNFDSQDLREQYLVNTNYFKRLMKNNPEDGLDKRALIERIVNENISSVNPLKDKPRVKMNIAIINYHIVQAHRQTLVTCCKALLTM